MNLIYPDWPVPKTIHALTTTRSGGISAAPYDSFNLAMHVNDNDCAVFHNREQLQKTALLPARPRWLIQTHSTNVINLDVHNDEDKSSYDACYSRRPNVVCAVLTADCLPILLCAPASGELAAIHSGWHGLCNGIIENTVRLFTADGQAIFAWLGPAIGPQFFVVGEEVKQAFTAVFSEAEHAFRIMESGQKYLADLYQLARQRLLCLGITAIYGGNYCTFTQSDSFYSYRRNGKTGRMATLIWRDK